MFHLLLVPLCSIYSQYIKYSNIYAIAEIAEIIENIELSGFPDRKVYAVDLRFCGWLTLRSLRCRLAARVAGSKLFVLRRRAFGLKLQTIGKVHFDCGKAVGEGK